MNEAVMTEASSSQGPQRRRSPRLGSPPGGDTSMALGAKRFITVRKIEPRRPAAPTQHDKENTPNRSQHQVQVQHKKQRVLTPDPLPGRGPSSSSAGRKKKKKQPQAHLPSPVLPSTPPAPSRTRQPAADPEDALWSQKVRRSYTRLSDRSPHSPGSRETLFGFERLQTPEVAPNRTEQSRSALGGSGSSFVSLLEAEEGCPEPDPEPEPEPDPNIPGVAVVKERRRRRKVQNINPEELDALAARMNEEFREAEEFQLLVE